MYICKKKNNMKYIIIILLAITTLTATAQRIRDKVTLTTIDTLSYILLDKATWSDYKKQSVAVLLSGVNKSISDIEDDITAINDKSYISAGFQELTDTVALTADTWTQVTNDDYDLFSTYTSNNISISGDTITFDDQGVYNVSGNIYYTYKNGYNIQLRLREILPSKGNHSYNIKQYCSSNYMVVSFNFVIVVDNDNTTAIMQLYGSDTDNIVYHYGQLTINKMN